MEGLCTTCTFLMLTHSLTHDDEDDDIYIYFKDNSKLDYRSPHTGESKALTGLDEHCQWQCTALPPQPTTSSSSSPPSPSPASPSPPSSLPPPDFPSL